MKFSIITPTLQRESLVACCRSLDEQTHKDWEHIVSIDGTTLNHELIGSLASNKRRFMAGGPYRNFGNGPRSIAWEYTTGDYVIYLDDDNYFSHPDALADIAFCLTAKPCDWAIFPILRFGQIMISADPGVCRTDSANMVIRREIAQWPNINDYTADGILAEQLKAKYPFEVFDKVKPIITVPVQSKGL